MEQAPTIEYAKEVLASENGTAMKYIAGEFGMGYEKFMRLLNFKKIAYASHGTFYLYSSYLDKGYTKNRTYPYTRSDGSQGSKTYTVWTEKGSQFLHHKLDNELQNIKY